MNIKATTHTTFRRDPSKDESSNEAETDSNTDFAATDRESQQEINETAYYDIDLTNS